MKKLFQGIIGLFIVFQLILSCGLNVVADTLKNIKKQNEVKNKKESISKHSPLTLRSARQMLSKISSDLYLAWHSSHVSHSSHSSHSSHVSHYSSSHTSHYSSTVPTPMPIPIPAPEVPSIQNIEKKDVISVLDWEAKQENIGIGNYYVVKGELKNNSKVNKSVKLRVTAYDNLEQEISTHFYYHYPFNMLPDEEKSFNIVLLYNPNIFTFKINLEWE